MSTPKDRLTPSVDPQTSYGPAYMEFVRAHTPEGREPEEYLSSRDWLDRSKDTFLLPKGHVPNPHPDAKFTLLQGPMPGATMNVQAAPPTIERQSAPIPQPIDPMFDRWDELTRKYLQK